MQKPISTELCIGRLPIGHFQPIHGHPSVIMGCNSRGFVEAVDTGRSLKNPWYVPLAMYSLLSLPQMSGKTSETREIAKQDAQTFENDSIF
jgi:hypothetical protein